MTIHRNLSLLRKKRQLNSMNLPFLSSRRWVNSLMSLQIPRADAMAVETGPANCCPVLYLPWIDMHRTIYQQHSSEMSTGCVLA